MPALVPEGFVIPRPLVDGAFRFEPLGTRHNVEDHLAWTSSIEHIQRTPGFAGRHWPGEPETLDENLLGLAQHEEDFTHRRGFAYAVRDVLALEYVGCVYFYPPRTSNYDVDVRSWVRSEQSHLDEHLHDAVRRWLVDAWPWRAPDYASR